MRELDLDDELETIEDMEEADIYEECPECERKVLQNFGSYNECYACGYWEKTGDHCDDYEIYDQKEEEDEVRNGWDYDEELEDAEIDDDEDEGQWWDDDVKRSIPGGSWYKKMPGAP